MQSSMQEHHLYSVHFAPRGSHRMAALGMQIAQQYLSPFDNLIGLIGDAGSGKSMVIKGMFPGLELTNDDGGVNIRPLPILSLEEEGFYTAHTFHLDIRFESGFTQMHILAEAILNALNFGKRVVVEHFELIYPFLGRNADLLIGVGEEIVVTRPTLFGPQPEDVSAIVFKSIVYRRMAHTAEDLCEFVLANQGIVKYKHADVRRGFILVFDNKPDIVPEKLEADVLSLIDENLKISFLNEEHILIGEKEHYCTGPRNHMSSSGEIKYFRLIKEIIEDKINDRYLLVGSIGTEIHREIKDLNRFESII